MTNPNKPKANVSRRRQYFESQKRLLCAVLATGNDAGERRRRWDATAA